MPEERDPVYRWVAAHQGWALVITILFIVCILFTVVGFAFLAASGALTPGPGPTR